MTRDPKQSKLQVLMGQERVKSKMWLQSIHFEVLTHTTIQNGCPMLTATFTNQLFLK
jgi:hypothetical protein